jgi:hypothetical protein
VGRRKHIRRRDRGGEGISALRPNRARVAKSLLALLVLAGTAASIAARSDRLVALVDALGSAAVLALFAGLVVCWKAILPWALVLCGAEYAAFLLLDQRAIDSYAPFYAVAFLVIAELSYWALEPETIAAEPGLLGRRASLIAAAALAGGGVGAMILTVSEFAIHGGLLLEAVGVAASIAVVFLLARLARVPR